MAFQSLVLIDVATVSSAAEIWSFADIVDIARYIAIFVIIFIKQVFYGYGGDKRTETILLCCR